ncbi:hypothetical protein SJZ84_13140 [Hafnia paralvei]|nr:hypothetical protein [Hafnia paralvei]MDX6911771.1 hypothetical protein [Hafnia paralvei]
MEKITRVEAAKRGMNKFYTGKRCRHGHDAERYTINGACVECNATHSAAQRKRIQLLMAGSTAEV